MELQVLDNKEIERVMPLLEANVEPLVGLSPLVKSPYLLMQTLNREASRVVAAVEGEKILGFVYMEERDDTVNIPLIMVASEDRGKGIGRRLLLAAYEAARRSGLHSVTLEVLVDNRPMEDLIRGLGFEMTAERPPFRAYRLEIPSR